MGDKYGGAKPKTKTSGRNGVSSHLSRGNNSSNFLPMFSFDDPVVEQEETSFDFSLMNGHANQRDNASLKGTCIPGEPHGENVYTNDTMSDRVHKGARPKSTKFVHMDMKPVNLSGGQKKTELYSGSGLPVNGGVEKIEVNNDIRNSELSDSSKRVPNRGKLSRQKEQEYLSARERWKKSGLALRKYIAEKLGFSQDKHKQTDSGDVSRGRNQPRSMPSSAEKKSKAKQEKSVSMDMLNACNGFEREEHMDRSESPKTRLEHSREGEALPRSRSFLKYLGLKKEKNSPKAGTNRLKVSKSFDMSSSDAWPESSTDTCKSAASDWSADNTLTNHRTDYTSMTNKKCQSTQTCGAVPTHKCDRGTKTEHTGEPKHKLRKHKKAHKSKTSKDSKKTKHKDSHLQNESKPDREDQASEVQPGKWVGVLDDEISRSSEDEYEFVLDHEQGEIVRRVKEKKQHPDSEQHNSDNKGDSKQRRSTEISDSTVEAMLGLHHALPYLPESFRTRLSAVQNEPDSQLGTTGTSSFNCEREGTLGDLFSNSQREATTDRNLNERLRDTANVQSDTARNQLPDSFVRKRRGNRQENKKSMKNKENWKKRYDRTGDIIGEMDNYMFDSIEDYERNLEGCLEDPFQVRRNSDLDLCSGLMDLVRDIDIPFIDDDGETRFNDSCGERFKNSSDARSKSSSDETFRNSSDAMFNNSSGVSLNELEGTLPVGGNYLELNTLHRDSKTIGNDSDRFPSVGIDSKLDCFNERSFEDDPDYPGLKHLNDSFDRLLDDGDTDSSSGSSVLNGFLQRSRSEESRARSKSSDDTCSLEADDEFECECDHCQLLRQHSYGTHNLDLLPPRYSEDMGFSYDLDLSTESSAAGQSDPDSGGGFRSAMFLDDYDFLLDRSSNELDWLIVDNRPLSVMLEDVIQQMLAVQPELLNEQAAPPAPKIVIESLPTLSLTSTHIVQHPSCPICLCPSEVEEVMTLLPCQHIFHPICIQAWLIKSGTCPVCRGSISR